MLVGKSQFSCHSLIIIVIVWINWWDHKFLYIFYGPTSGRGIVLGFDSIPTFSLDIFINFAQYNISVIKKIKGMSNKTGNKLQKF